MVLLSPSVGKTYTDSILVRGDSDKAKRWGGSVKHGIGGTPVADLQKALIAVGVLDGGADGDFGKHTQDGIRRFQWNVTNIAFQLVSGLLRFKGLNLVVKVNGMNDANTSQELKKWVAAGAVTTGNLVRADLSHYPQLENGFKKINNPSVTDDELVIDADFVDSLGILNKEAKSAKVTLYVTQGFRVNGAPVSGAVVPPATYSQHLIGHAIDCNIRDGETLNSSDVFEYDGETDAADIFIAAVKKKGLRWGGDFQKRDYVHFDDNVTPGSDGYMMRFFFNQRTISKNHQIRAAS